MQELITGYHGTLKRNVAKIINDSFFTSNKDTEWLGWGVYFYQYYAHAWQWADDQCVKPSSKPDDEPAVLMADICVEQDNVLDLDDPVQLNELDEFFEKALSYSSEKREMLSKYPEKKEKLRRCLACNLYCESYGNIQLIKYTFWGRNKKGNKKEVVYPKTERQLCVKDKAIIKNVKEVGRDGKEIS